MHLSIYTMNSIFSLVFVVLVLILPKNILAFQILKSELRHFQFIFICYKAWLYLGGITRESHNSIPCRSMKTLDGNYFFIFVWSFFQALSLLFYFLFVFFFLNIEFNVSATLFFAVLSCSAISPFLTCIFAMALHSSHGERLREVCHKSLEAYSTLYSCWFSSVLYLSHGKYPPKVAKDSSGLI